MEMEFPGQVIGVLAGCLAMGGVCAAAVFPWMVLTTRRWTTVTRRSAYDRCARQLTLAALVCGLGMLGVGVSLLAVSLLAVSLQAVPLPEAHAVYRPEIWVLAGLALFGGVAEMTMRPLALLRDGLGAGLTAAGILAGVSLGVLLLGVVLMHLPAVPDMAPAAVSAGVPHHTLVDTLRRMGAGMVARPERALLAGLGVLGLGLAFAGGLALLLLLVRRHADDFGRDYYRLAASWCARWGAWGCVLLLVVTGGGWWLLLPSLLADVSAPPVWGLSSVWFWAGGGGLALLAAVACWAIVAGSEHPMRLKSLMLIGLLGVYVWLVAGAWLVARAWML